MTENTKEQKRVIVITGIRPTLSLYEPLSKHYTVAVYNPESAQKLAAAQGGPVVCPLQGAGQPLIHRAQNEAAWMSSRVVATLPGTFSTNGENPIPLKGWAPGAALRELLNTLVYVRVMDHYAKMDGVDIAGVVVHEDVMPVHRALALWAKDRGIPVIHVPHANAFGQTRPDIHDESIADWILATSPHMRDWYADRGFVKRRIKVVGYPAWDPWASAEDEPGMRKPTARRMLRIDENKPTVALCTGWPQRTNVVDDHSMIDAAIHLTLEAARQRGWQLIWKLHPGDAQGREQQAAGLAAAYRVPALATRDHLPLVLAAADVVLAVGPSNVLVEAGLMDRPPALFDLRGYGFETEPPWSVAPDVGSVVEVVESLVDGTRWQPVRDKFIKRYAYRNDGKATKRCVRQIRRIVEAASE